MSKITEIAAMLQSIQRNHGDAESDLSNASSDVGGVEYEIGLGVFETCPEPETADEARDAMRDCENVISHIEDVVAKLEDIISSLNNSVSYLSDVSSTLDDLADLYDEEENFEVADKVVFLSGFPDGTHTVLAVHENSLRKKFAWLTKEQYGYKEQYGDPVSASFSELKRYEL